MESLSPWEKYKQNLGDTRPWDLLNPKTEFADEELTASRYSVCLGCPELISLTTQCKKCGCIMKAKTKLKSAICPLGKW